MQLTVRACLIVVAMSRKRRKGPKTGHNFPTKLNPDQVALIRGIYKLDRKERRKAGFSRGTNGLRDRMAIEFKVTVWCIESITKDRRWKRVRAKIL